MRPLPRFTLFLVLTLGLGAIGDRSIPAGSTSLPPLARLLSPFGGYLRNAEQSFGGSESIELGELGGTAEVVFDKRRVPHIFAKNLEDAVYINGYLHARERLWQMDLMTRATSGRLSEVLGPAAVDYDRLTIRRGLPQAAKNAAEAWKAHPESYRLLEAYTAGVNRYISQLTPSDYPLEFKLINYKPEPWSVYKSALVFKSLTYDLAFRHDDLEATNSLAHFGREVYAYLYPERMEGDSPVIPEGTDWSFAAVGQPSDTIDIPTIEGLLGQTRFRPMPEAHLGSNNWAVSGEKTRSGHPILANDPHLALRLPSVWYEIEINCPELHARGVSLPGQPGILIGFNKDIAWGETNGGHDVVDWYKPDWTEREDGKYRSGGTARQAEMLSYEIKVRGGGTLRETLPWTEWGPVVYDDPGHPLDGYAMRWIAHDAQETDEVGTFLRLNRASNRDEYLDAIRGFACPVQNFIFASTEGDIAIKVQGKLPIRRYREGRFVSDPDALPNAWQDYIPNEHMPYIVNPGRGFVSSANQVSTDESYPYEYHGYFNHYRGRYLNDRLESMQSMTARDMMDLQTDNYSYLAREGMAVLLKYTRLQDLEEEERDWYERLVGWDLKFIGDMAEPALFDRWLRRFYRGTWDEMFEYEGEEDLLLPSWWRTMEIADEEEGSRFFDRLDTEEVEGPDDIVTDAFREAVEVIDERLGSDPSFGWYKQRASGLRHVGMIDAFSVLELRTDGYRQALNALGRTSGPSWRMVVELGSPVKGYGVYPGGQSGNPGSPWYDDFVPAWLEGRYYELRLHGSPEEIREDRLFQLECKPAP